MSMESCKAFFDLCKIAKLKLVDVPQSDADYVLVISQFTGPTYEIPAQRRKAHAAINDPLLTNHNYEIHDEASFRERYKSPSTEFSEISELDVTKSEVDAVHSMLANTVQCR